MDGTRPEYAQAKCEDELQLAHGVMAEHSADEPRSWIFLMAGNSKCSKLD